jgi:hypothetical protein
MIAKSGEPDDNSEQPQELEDGSFVVNGKVYVSTRECLRREGVLPGAQIRFPEGAFKQEFWDAYPRDELAFRRRMLPEGYLEKGIEYFPPDSPMVERRPLRDEYQGIPRQEVGHLCLMWRMDPAGFAERHSPRELQAIQEFLADQGHCKNDYLARKQAAKVDERPPTPPIGYHWQYRVGEWGIEYYALWFGESAEG